MSTKDSISAECPLVAVRESVSVRGGGRWVSWLVVLSTFCLGACSQKVANADETPPASTTLAARPGVATARGNGNADVDDEDALVAAEEAELRRGYGAVDMRFGACVTRPNESTLSGEGCPSGFVVYGPYVTVPANSEIDVTFEFKASHRVEVYADIVSRMASQTLAGLNRQVVEAGVKQKLGYRVHVFSAEVQVESRIGMTAEPGTNFEITNLSMSVR